LIGLAGRACACQCGGVNERRSAACWGVGSSGGAWRMQVGAWISEFSARHARTPTLEDASAADPVLYRKFFRYITLRDFVRSQAA